MNMKQNVFGAVAVREGMSVTGIDQSSLLRRLLLFDTVIIQSNRLREVAFLVRMFGKTGFRRLLDSGVLRLSCEFTMIGGDFKKNNKPRLPFCHFNLGVVDLHNREEALRAGLKTLQGISGLSNLERSQLEELVLGKLVRPTSTYGSRLLAQTEFDIRSNQPLLRQVLMARLEKELGTLPPDFDVLIEEPQERTFFVRVPLDRLGLDEIRSHEIISSAIFAVANLNHRIADMEAYGAISSFSEVEAPLLFGKLAAVVGPLNPQPFEETFQRVVTLGELPDFASTQRFDVDRLLTIRETKECQEFRAWLSEAKYMTDQEITEIVAGFKARLGTFAQNPTGKALRFAATTGIGFVPVVGPIAGTVVGALDAFLVDKVLPHSGVVAFLTDQYPSVFVSS